MDINISNTDIYHPECVSMISSWIVALLTVVLGTLKLALVYKLCLIFSLGVVIRNIGSKGKKKKKKKQLNESFV